jgi:hypothetical protein
MLEERLLVRRSIHDPSGHLRLRCVATRQKVTSLGTFARSYLVNGGDVISTQRILGHATLDMVRPYVELADTDLVGRRAMASPADCLLIGPRVSVILPQAIYRGHCRIATDTPDDSRGRGSWRGGVLRASGWDRFGARLNTSVRPNRIPIAHPWAARRRATPGKLLNLQSARS